MNLNLFFNLRRDHILKRGFIVLLLTNFINICWGVQKQRENKLFDTWSSDLRYSVLSDLADSRQPRGMTHSLSGDVEYHLTPSWTLGGGLNVHADTVNGQIYKDPQQAESEVLSPEAHIFVNYYYVINSQLNINSELSWDFLLDNASRREGYLGVLSASSSVSYWIPEISYALGNKLEISCLMNTYEFSSAGNYNPYEFFKYFFDNTFILSDHWMVGYVFGFKITRYLDNYWQYNYKNSYKIGFSYQSLSISLDYENGGFTDHGEVDLWYIDEYRRVVSLNVAYKF